MSESLIADLAKAKAVFQLRAITAAMGIPVLNQSNSTPLEIQPKDQPSEGSDNG